MRQQIAPQQRTVAPQPVRSPTLLQQGATAVEQATAAAQKAGQDAAQWADRNIGDPLRAGISRAQAAGQETVRTTITSVEALDGLMGIGVTRYRVTFMDGGQGNYDPHGRLLVAELGNPPATVPSAPLPFQAVGGPAPVGSPANGPTRIPGGLRLRPVR